ncbi:MAG: capsule biosynthesis protein [Pseudomonas sp.]
MTQDAVSNPWGTKARALDRYRWLLLRERHGRLGSALRFARELAGDWLFGLRAKRRLAVAVTTEACDFLLLQSAPKVIKFQRKKLLIEGLRARGHSLVETALEEPRVILRQRLLKRPPCRVPTRYFGHAAYAEWLVERYQPRILLNDRNGSLYAPFLRLALNSRQRLLVHLAHATTVEGSRRLGMNDYDYYFLFGQSSLEALQDRALRFGTSTAVLAGSHMIDRTFDLPAAEAERRVLLVLGVGPDKEKEAGYQRTYALLRDWAAENPDYQVLIKAHPRSQVPFWHDVAEALDNLQVLPPSYGLAEALGYASVVVNIMSNAVIEAALARRPVVHVNASGEQDIFGQERFLGACVNDLPALTMRLEQIVADYPASIVHAQRFAEFHLAQGVEGLSNTLGLLDGLLVDGRCAGQHLPPACGVGGSRSA